MFCISFFLNLSLTRRIFKINYGMEAQFTAILLFLSPFCATNAPKPFITHNKKAISMWHWVCIMATLFVQWFMDARMHFFALLNLQRNKKLLQISKVLVSLHKQCQIIPNCKFYRLKKSIVRIENEYQGGKLREHPPYSLNYSFCS